MDINLKAEQASLVLSVGKENDWTGVTLKKDGKSEFLGSDVLDIIATRFYKALKEPESIDSEQVIEGHNVKWITHLSEMQTSLYGALEIDKLRLFIQDTEGAITHSILLNSVEVDAWTEELKKYARV